MWYFINCEDKPNSLELRLKTRPAHLEYIQKLQDEGRVLTAGPLPAIDSESPGENGFTGSMMILEFNSLEEAEKWSEDDPYNLAGVFQKVTVKPFIKVF
jgi:uncharacterized protein YciI